jgi:glycosyltransferase involved in cell wall biosynthesis
LPDGRVIIVVPCFNEALRLPVEEFHRFLLNSQVHFVLVDDGSRDRTKDRLEEVKAGFEDRVIVHQQPKNGGKAEAVRTGMNLAFALEPTFVGFWDADLATPLDAIPRFLGILDHRPELDMVFGSRVKLLGRDVQRNAARHYLGRIFATAVSTLLGLPIYDTQCGAKIFRAGPETRALTERPFLSRWTFDVEMLARYISVLGPSKAAKRIYEYPLESWQDVAGSKVKAYDFFVALRDIARIWWTYRSGLRAESSQE